MGDTAGVFVQSAEGRLTYSPRSPPSALLERIVEFRGKGTLSVLVFLLRRVLEVLRVSLTNEILDRSFEVGGNRIPYYTLLDAFRPIRSGIPLVHRLANVIWKLNGERAVELPWVVECGKGSTWGRCLEVGNVLGYYYGAPPRVIVDKYEHGSGILNVDVCDYSPVEPFDTIVSISTLEHVGFDETPKDDYKFLRAISNLQSILSQSGRMIITIPLHYNPAIDAAIKADILPQTGLHFMAKVDEDANAWIEVSKAEALLARESLLLACLRKEIL